MSGCEVGGVVQVIHRLKAAVSLLAVTMILAGCWSRHEIESLGFALGTGLDAAMDAPIRVTLQIARPQDLVGSPTQGGGGGAKQPVWVIDVTGDTVFDAIRNLREKSPRTLFMGHSRVLIVGEELAREGLAPHLDFFVRDAEPRLAMLVMVAKETTANDVLKARFGLEDNPADGLFDLTLTRTGTSESYVIDLNHFLQRLQDEGIEPVASRVERERLGASSPVPTGEQPAEDAAVVEPHGLRLTGLAVFKDDKLIGWLGGRETRGFLWVMGEVESGIAVLSECPDGKPLPTSVELIEKPRSSVKVDLKDGRPSVTIHVIHEGVIGDTACESQLNDQAIKVMERQLAEAVENEIQAAIDRAQFLGSDIFGFGAKLLASDQKAWKERFRDQWSEWFANIDVTIHVESYIRKSGLVRNRFSIK